MKFNAIFLFIVSSLVACGSDSLRILSADSGLGSARSVIGASDCTHVVPNGTYATTINSRSYPPGAVVCAENDGQAVFTGVFEPSGYNMRGFVVTSRIMKKVSNGTFERMSFVGGPACGNEINTALGNNTIVRDSAFYGLGGRYLLLAYKKSGIRINNAILRVDGGWGETNPCNDFGPNAAMAFYDTNNAVCDGCINIDQNPTAASNSENLGGLGLNAHSKDLCYSVEIRNSVDYNATYFWAGGNGRCNPLFNNVKGSLTIALKGTATVNNSTGNKCNTWSDPIISNNSSFAAGNCASTGTGVNLKLDKDFLDDPRWRREMCGEFSDRTDGWCGTRMLLSEYISD